MNEIVERLRQIVGEENLIVDAPMSKYTSFRAGGSADCLVEPENVQELQEVLKTIKDVPHMVLGNGSNVLVKDGGYRGVIVRLGDGFNSIRVVGNRMICGAGALLSTIAKAAASSSLTGLEFASGIPGSMGGAVFMNAGAYGGEIKMVLEEAHLVSPNGEKYFIMKKDDLEMSYRHSAIQETGDIVVEVVLKLEEGEEEEIRGKMAELTAQRNAKQPVQYPSAGSFFKRPEGYYAGKLVQDAGCKGLSVGGAQVSTLHSGFVINTGGATATDIIRLKNLVQACVMEQFGVMLEPEVRIVGEDPADTSVDKYDGHIRESESQKENEEYFNRMYEASTSEKDLETSEGDSEASRDKHPLEEEYRMLYDLHTHTTYSHGSGSIEDNVRVAIDKGLEYVAISDHGPGHLFYGVNRNDFPNMRNDIDKMSVKYQSISVKNSIEANIVHSKGGTGKGHNGLDLSPEEFEEFDFIIAGFHFGCFRCSSIRNWLWSHGIKINEKQLKKSNTKMICDALRNNDIAILTHPGDKGPFDIAEIAKVCVETDTLIEINGRHGHLTREEIQIAKKEADLKFIISSDAHTPEAVGEFGEALQRAIDAGLDVSRIVNIRKK